MELEEEHLLQEWFIKFNIRESTQEIYKLALDRYCKFTEKKPIQLVEEALSEERNPKIDKRMRKVNGYLLRYIYHLDKELELAPGTVDLYYYAIRSFYKANYVDLPYIKRNQGDKTLEENRSKGMMRENILKLANAASPRERALIYLMALSGMGNQEARNLTIKKIIESASSEINIQLENVYDLFKYEDKILDTVLPLHIRRQKVSYDYHTFIPPEATREIINYLKERCYGRNEKIRVNNNNDYIFVSNNGNKLSSDSVVTNFRRIGQKAGFKREKGSFSFWRSHSLRAYFITTFINKTGQKILADYLAGHKISEQDRSYWKANPKDLEKHYLKVLPDLTLDKAKVKDVQSNEFKILTEELENKDAMIKDMKTEMGQIKEEMRNEMNAKIEKIMDDLTEKYGRTGRSIPRHIREKKNILRSLKQQEEDEKYTKEKY